MSGSVSPTFSVSLVDFDGQVVKSDSGSLMTVKRVVEGSVLGQNAVQVREGVGLLREIIFEGEPGTTVDY